MTGCSSGAVIRQTNSEQRSALIRSAVPWAAAQASTLWRCGRGAQPGQCQRHTELGSARFWAERGRRPERLARRPVRSGSPAHIYPIVISSLCPPTRHTKVPPPLGPLPFYLERVFFFFFWVEKRGRKARWMDGRRMRTKKEARARRDTPSFFWS